MSNIRYRQPEQPVIGHPGIPAASTARLGTHAAGTRGDETRLGRIVHMEAVGLWAILLDGALVEDQGVGAWEDEAALRSAARRQGVELSDLITRTGSAI